MVSTVLSLESLNTLSRAAVTSWLRVASVRRGEVGNCIHVACTRIAAMNRPIACGSDIFLPLPLSAASPNCQSRRVAILICSIRGAGSTGVSGSVLITFASGAYILPCEEIKIQVVGIYGMFPMAERRIQEVYSSSISSWLFVPWKKSNGWMSTYLT